MHVCVISLQQNRALPAQKQLQYKFPAVGNGAGIHAGTRAPVSTPIKAPVKAPEIAPKNELEFGASLKREL